MVPNPGFDVVDVFAGQQSISKAWCKPQHHVGMFQHRILKVLGSFFWHIPMFPIDPKQLYFQKTCCLGLKAVTEQQAWTVTSIKLQWIFWNRQVSCFSPGLAIWLSRNGVGNPKGTPPSKEVACAILELLLGFKKTGNLQLKSGFVDQVRFLKELLPGFV